MSQTAKVLLLYAHPESQDSVANRVLLEPALQLPNVTVHDLYAHYPDFFIDIAYEQDLLRQHEVIVFQHPLYTELSGAAQGVAGSCVKPRLRQRRRRERTGGKVLAQRDHYRRA